MISWTTDVNPNKRVTNDLINLIINWLVDFGKRKLEEAYYVLHNNEYD